MSVVTHKDAEQKKQVFFIADFLSSGGHFLSFYKSVVLQSNVRGQAEFIFFIIRLFRS